MDRIRDIMGTVNGRIPVYMKTTPGLLKLWCLVFNLLAFGINLIPFENQVHYTLRPGLEFDEVALVGFVITAILLLLVYHHETDSEQQKLQWIKIEMYFCGLWAALYMFVITLTTIGNINCLKHFQTHVCTSHIFATIFGFLAMLGYVNDSLLKYRDAKRLGVLRPGTNLTSVENGSIRHTEYFNSTDRTIYCA